MAECVRITRWGYETPGQIHIFEEVFLAGSVQGSLRIILGFGSTSTLVGRGGTKGIFRRKGNRQSEIARNHFD